MRRRTFVTMAALAGTALSGCLSRSPGGAESPESDGSETAGNERRYEACPREVIPYEQFPEDVQSEIDAALEGEHVADRIFLREAMETGESYVSLDGEYYDPTVSESDGSETLTLEAVEPKALPEPRSVSVEHTGESERTVTVEVLADDGTVLIEETRTLDPGGTIEFGETDRVGTHELRVTVAENDRIETEETDSMRVGESYFRTLVVLETDDVLVTGDVAEIGPCRYDE